MIRFITGVPGAGKSYYAVNHIYNVITDAKYKERYLHIYTNIDHFNFEISSRICPFNYDLLFEKLKRLHKHYKKKKGDHFLIRMARRFKIYKSLFVIDEAHNHFDVRNPVLVWWLSYHRHLYQDIDLITQNLSLIDSKYKGFTEYFVRAVPQSLRLFSKTFRYNLFIDSRMSQKSKAGVEKIKYNPEVFKLYHSGDKPKTKNIILRFLLIALALFVPVIAILYFIENKWTSKSEDKTVAKTTVQQKENQTVTIQTKNTIQNNQMDITDDMRLIRILCVKSSCYYQKTMFPLPLLNDLISNTQSKLLNIDTDYRTYQTELYVLATENFQNIFKGVSDEKSDFVDIDLFASDRKTDEHK